MRSSAIWRMKRARLPGYDRDALCWRQYSLINYTAFEHFTHYGITITFACIAGRFSCQPKCIVGTVT